MKKLFLACLSAALVIGEGAMAGEVAWIPGETSLGGGVITVTYDGEAKVTSIIATPADDETLTMTGTEAIPFADGATVSVANGKTFSFEVPISSSGALNFGLLKPAIYYDNASDFLPGSETEAVVIARGFNLEDYEIARSEYNLHGNTKSYILSTTKSVPMYVVRGAGNADGDAGNYSHHLTCQVQGKDDYARCVFLELRQRGEEIVAWVQNPAWYSGNISFYGRDFLTLPIEESNNGRRKMDVASVAKNKSGYGISTLELTARDGRIGTVLLKKTVQADKLQVNQDVLVSAEGCEALTETENWGTSLDLTGTFRIRNHVFAELSGAVSYHATQWGMAELVLLADEAPGTPQTEVDVGDYPNGEWTVVARDASVFSVTNLSANGAGGWLAETGPMGCYFFKKDAQKLSCQFQCANGGYLKGVIYELRQAGPDIEGRIERAANKYYASDETAKSMLGKKNLTDKDCDQSDIRTDVSAVGYGLLDLRLWLDGRQWRSVVLGGAVSSSSVQKGGRLCLYGSTNVGMVAQFADANSVHPVAVHSQAVCISNADRTPEHDWPIEVGEGGQFLQVGSWTVHSDTKPVISGGEIVVGADVRDSSKIGNLYLSRVTFENGGTISGGIPCSGYYFEPNWKVSGSRPAMLASGIALTSHSAATSTQTATFDVDDVTGDATADLTIGGRICYGNWNNIGIRKRGLGTVLAMAKNEAVLHPLTIAAGTWLLGSTDAMTDAHVVHLTGGTLGAAAGTTNAVGEVEIADGVIGALRLDPNADLTVSSLALGMGAKLFVTSDIATSRIRILQHLDAMTLNRIRINGKRVTQNEDGTVEQGNFGLMLLFR